MPPWQLAVRSNFYRAYLIAHRFNVLHKKETHFIFYCYFIIFIMQHNILQVQKEIQKVHKYRKKDNCTMMDKIDF